MLLIVKSRSDKIEVIIFKLNHVYDYYNQYGKYGWYVYDLKVIRLIIVNYSGYHNNHMKQWQ